MEAARIIYEDRINTEEWKVVHKDGHEHTVTVINSFQTLLDKVKAYNSKNPTNKKFLRRYRKIIPTTLTLKFDNNTLVISVSTYHQLVNKRKIVVYWYGMLYIFPNVKFLRDNITGPKNKVFIIDPDWFKEITVDISEKLEVEEYEH